LTDCADDAAHEVSPFWGVRMLGRAAWQMRAKFAGC
jgi:hypothetical protein